MEAKILQGKKLALAVEISVGQNQAIQQLSQISQASGGALEIIGDPEGIEKTSLIKISVSISTKDYPRATDGLKLRDREKLSLYIPTDFPFDHPLIYFTHTRNLGKAHVQWGRYICLYLSPQTEWLPPDGMYGFMDRIDSWLRAASAGQLDPEEAPLHPPASYTVSATQFVLNSDTPDLTGKTVFWIGRANLESTIQGQYHLNGWVPIDNWNDADLPNNFAAALLLKVPLPFEYPEKVLDMVEALQKAGVEFNTLFHVLRLAANHVGRGNPAFLVLGAPMRRRAAGEPLKQHLTVWEIPGDSVNALQDIGRSTYDHGQSRSDLLKWFAVADVRWCTTYENRDEVTYRRDIDSIASEVKGKRILLLGCGALGSTIANHIVRAGAAVLEVADYGKVKPGLLVRQQFRFSDIGRLKTEALAEELEDIGANTNITQHPKNLAKGVSSQINLAEIDLIIDATASKVVNHRIEREINEGKFVKPLLSVSISARGEYGSISIKMPEFKLGPISINRLSALEAWSKYPNHPATSAFWPTEAPTHFQPEPGCSDPTFQASAADVNSHASSLLNIGLRKILELNEDEAYVQLMGAHWLPNRELPIEIQLDDPECYQELNFEYSVCHSPTAKRIIDTEIRRNARVRSDTIETGGLLFGEIDESHGRIYIDTASGPPSDSEASADKFLCGTAGTRELAEAVSRQSGKRSRFLGIWHTHPVSPGHPSGEDMMAIIQLLHLQDNCPRQILMLIVGQAASDPEFNHYLYRRDGMKFFRLDDDGAELEAFTSA